MKIIMYTKDKCPNCERAKFMLNYSPVPVNLEIRNIESGEKAGEYEKELKEVLKSNSLPTMMIPYSGVVPNPNIKVVEDDSELFEMLIGFDENLGKLQELLGL